MGKLRKEEEKEKNKKYQRKYQTKCNECMIQVW